MRLVIDLAGFEAGEILILSVDVDEFQFVDTKTGEIDKIDGPYYFFKLIQKMRRMMPAWMPTPGIEGGRINIVPVDFVAAALDHIAHLPRLDGKCFHLTDPKPKRIGQVLNIFAEAGHAPQMSMRFDARMLNLVPGAVRQGLMMLPPVRRMSQCSKNATMPSRANSPSNASTMRFSRSASACTRAASTTLPATWGVARPIAPATSIISVARRRPAR